MIRKEEGKTKWKNTGGPLNFRGEIYGPGQTFYAYEDDIPKGFRDTVIPVETPASKKKRQAVIETPKFEIRSVGYGWYNVINKETGKQLNDKGMREDAAKKLVQELS